MTSNIKLQNQITGQDRYEEEKISQRRRLSDLRESLIHKEQE